MEFPECRWQFISFVFKYLDLGSKESLKWAGFSHLTGSPICPISYVSFSFFLLPKVTLSLTLLLLIEQ